MKYMNSEKNINDNESLEIEEQSIGEPKAWDGVSRPSQELLDRWYSHTSNKERTIADWERQREEDSNPFED